jgi:hypothetical protein
MYSKRGRKAQVTLFVILAIVIVGIVLAVYFLIPKTKPPANSSEPLNPTAYLQSCYNDNLEPYLSEISLQGGYFQPSPFFKIIEDGDEIKMQFLSSQGIIQKPLIEQDIEDQLETKMKSIAKNCIKNYAAGLITKGNQVTTCNPNLLTLDITLEPDKVFSNVTCKINITTKDDKKLAFSQFSIYQDSQLYGVVSLARDILNAERTNNIQEVLELIVNYQLSHPEVLIFREERTQTPYQDITYRIIYGENKFYFAIRK